MNDDPNAALVIGDAGTTPRLMEQDPESVLEDATRAAHAIARVIEQKVRKVIIRGRQYLEFEDWQTLGHFYGYTTGAEGEPEFVQYTDADGKLSTGFRATAVVFHRGRIVSRAHALCMDDEKDWMRSSFHAMASMAQTRACAKSLRQVLSWVVVLKGLAATPAEEMSDGEEDDRPATERKQPPKQPPWTPSPDQGKAMVTAIRKAGGTYKEVAGRRIVTIPDSVAVQVDMDREFDLNDIVNHYEWQALSAALLDHIKVQGAA